MPRRGDWTGRVAPPAVTTRLQARVVGPTEAEGEPDTPPRPIRVSSAPPESTPRRPAQDKTGPRGPRPAAEERTLSPTRKRGRPPKRAPPKPGSQAKTGSATQTGAGPPEPPGVTPPGPLQAVVQEEAAKVAAAYRLVQAFAAQLDELVAELNDLHPTLAGRLSERVAAALRECSRPDQMDPSPAPRAASPKSDTTYATAVSGRPSPVPEEPTAAGTSKPGASPSAPQPGPQRGPRLMVRLPPDHELRTAGSLAARNAANACNETRDLFRDAMPVSTGFALLARDTPSAALAASASEALREHLRALAVEPEEKWTAYILRPVPRQVRGVPGLSDSGVPVTTDMIATEVALQTGLRPRRTAWTRKTEAAPLEGEAALTEGEAIVHFPAELTEGTRLPARIRIFGQAAWLRPRTNTRRPLACGKCFGFHNETACRRNPRCGQCGLVRHDGVCVKPVRCLNCRGPHASTAADCPARPSVRHGALVRPTKGQLQAIRAAGSRLWAAANAPAGPAPGVGNESGNRPAGGTPHTSTPSQTTQQ